MSGESKEGTGSGTTTGAADSSSTSDADPSTGGELPPLVTNEFLLLETAGSTTRIDLVRVEGAAVERETLHTFEPGTFVSHFEPIPGETRAAFFLRTSERTDLCVFDAAADVPSDERLRRINKNALPDLPSDLSWFPGSEQFGMEFGAEFWVVDGEGVEPARVVARSSSSPSTRLVINPDSGEVVIVSGGSLAVANTGAVADVDGHSVIELGDDMEIGNTVVFQPETDNLVFSVRPSTATFPNDFYITSLAGEFPTPAVRLTDGAVASGAKVTEHGLFFLEGPLTSILEAQWIAIEDGGFGSVQPLVSPSSVGLIYAYPWLVRAGSPNGRYYTTPAWDPETDRHPWVRVRFDGTASPELSRIVNSEDARMNFFGQDRWAYGLNDAGQFFRVDMDAAEPVGTLIAEGVTMVHDVADDQRHACLVRTAEEQGAFEVAIVENDVGTTEPLTLDTLSEPRCYFPPGDDRVVFVHLRQGRLHHDLYDRRDLSAPPVSVDFGYADLVVPFPFFESHAVDSL